MNQYSVGATLAHPASLPEPAQTDSRLAPLASQCGVQLRVVPRSKAKYDRSGAFLGYETLPGHDATVRGDQDALARLRSKVERSLAPTPTDDIEVWLAELSVIAPSRQHDPLTDELRMTAYSSRLATYPADVVRHVLLGQVWRFWPSWAELHEACEAAVSPRRAMLAAIVTTQAKPPALMPEADPAPEDAAEVAARRARISAVVADFLGKREVS